MKSKKLIFGMGINDADYEIAVHEVVNGKRKITWKCPYYSRWYSMITRCYSKRWQEKYPTYVGCSVCTEWLTFSNFKKWMEHQDWEYRQLDKDFLVEDNKTYSPSTCVFIPSKLNTFIITRGNGRGYYPIGVSYLKKSKDMLNELNKPYRSAVSDQKGKSLNLGTFVTSEEAHQVYLKAKLGQCISYIGEFKDEPLLVKGLERIKDKIQYHIDNNLELTSF